MTPEERRNDIAALRALDKRKWAALIAHHQNELKAQEGKKK